MYDMHLHIFLLPLYQLNFFSRYNQCYGYSNSVSSRRSLKDAMTQRNISRATSRVTESLFYIAVFAFLILFNSEQRLDDYILC